MCKVRLLPAIALFCTLLIPSGRTAAQQARDTPSQNSTYTFKRDVSVVLVPVVVRDKQGNAVGGLKKETFQIFDNDKPQAISGFSIQKRERIGSENRTVQQADARGATSPPTLHPDRFVVFLFDDLHLNIGDLAQAKKAGAAMLSTSLTPTDMAGVVSMSGNVNSGLTSDRAKLGAAIMKLQPQSLFRMTGSECPPMSYYQADQIENKHNSGALEAAIDEVASCSPGISLRSLAERLAESAATAALLVGDQDIQVTLASIKDYVRRMAALPGQRTLILVSPGFLTLTTKALSEESAIMDAAAEANVTVSALDARGLYVSEVDASERGGSSPLSSRLKSEYRRNSMSSNENVMAELAAGTGGTYFHNSNDLEGGFKRLTAGPEYLYLLEFSIESVKQNGSYHRLKVKVDQAGLKVQSRRGYFSPKRPKKKK